MPIYKRRGWVKFINPKPANIKIKPNTAGKPTEMTFLKLPILS